MLLQTNADPPIVLVDPVRLLPRYWATAWACNAPTKFLARNTLKVHLRHLAAFYEHCDQRYGVDSLDAAISTRNAQAFQSMVDSFYIELTAAATYTTTTTQRWDSVRRFAKAIAQRRSAYTDGWREVSRLLDTMSAIRPPMRGRFKFARALPVSTLRDLLEVAAPGSPRNPFVGESIQLRNWFIVNLLLLCGLRRGEALLLAVDALKREVDPDSGEMVYWLDVTTTTEDDDVRATRPSMKTTQSHRQIPVSESLAALYDLYLADARVPSARHGFLLAARSGSPLSAESLNQMTRDLTGALRPDALQRFRERTGGKEHVSPHDLRHTCATARYSMFMAAEPNRELTLQRMRAFFGWSLTSEMPELYARAAVQDDLLRSWKRLFDDRVSLLRSLEP